MLIKGPQIGPDMPGALDLVSIENRKEKELKELEQKIETDMTALKNLELQKARRERRIQVQTSNFFLDETDILTVSE